MEQWKCDHCKVDNEGEYWESCKGCGVLRQYADASFVKRLAICAWPGEQAASKEPVDKEAIRVLEAAKDRIGHTQKDRLEWLTRMAYEPPRTPEAWANFERDIFFLGTLDGYLEVAAIKSIRLPVLPVDFGKRVMGRLQPILKKAIAREPIQFRNPLHTLTWNATVNIFMWGSGREAYDHWNILDYCLQNAIRDYGELLKRCPAPAVRAKKGETCGRWFLAKRPNQEYCSATCVSRKTTRDNPPKPKKRKRDRSRKAD
jgi:hypothetical protein